MIVRGSKSSWIALTIVVVVGGLLLIAVFRSRWSAPPSLVDAAFQRTRDTMATLSMVPLRERGDVERALAAIAVGGDADVVSDAQVLSLRSAVADFVSLYYLREAPDDYKQYRRGEGCTLASRDALDQSVWPIADSIEYLNEHHASDESRIDAELEIEEIFDALWYLRQEVEGAQKPVLISTGAPGTCATVQRMSSVRMIFDDFGSGLGRDAWLGGSTMGGRAWFQSPNQPDENGILLAQVGIVFEFKDGVRRPLLFVLSWSGHRELWHLENVLMTNRPSSHFAWPWEL